MKTNIHRSSMYANYFGKFFLVLATTVCIRIVADCGRRISQFTNKLYADYNAHIYLYLGYYFYTLL